MKVRLGDICEIAAGGTPARNYEEYWQEGNIPWVKIGDFKNKYLNETEEKITALGLNNSSAKLFPKGTILYTIFATLGEVCILNIDAATNQAICGMKIKDHNIEDNYLYYYLCSIKDSVIAQGRGVAQNNINLSILRNLEIEVCSLDKQKKIASVLDNLTALIEKRKQQLEKLDLLIKSKFIEMFGDPILNEKKMPLDMLSNIAYLKAGKNITAQDLHDFSEETAYPCYGGNGIRGFVSKWSHDGTYCLIGRQGALCGNVQFVAGKFYATEHAVVVNLIGQDNVIWLYYCLKYLDLNRLQTGAAQPGLNIDILSKVMMLRPVIEAQNQFAKNVKQIDKTKSTIKQSLEKLETLKKSLMQKYFG